MFCAAVRGALKPKEDIKFRICLMPKGVQSSRSVSGRDGRLLMRLYTWKEQSSHRPCNWILSHSITPNSSSSLPRKSEFCCLLHCPDHHSSRSFSVGCVPDQVPLQKTERSVLEAGNLQPFFPYPLCTHSDAIKLWGQKGVLCSVNESPRLLATYCVANVLSCHCPWPPRHAPPSGG